MCIRDRFNSLKLKKVSAPFVCTTFLAVMLSCSGISNKSKYSKGNFGFWIWIFLTLSFRINFKVIETPAILLPVVIIIEGGDLFLSKWSLTEEINNFLINGNFFKI